eukprot:GHVQ01041070.1.p2 GENE.GHVQ01041070.1~~GHVQ01041070.1.p2  ORF type:complete len:119 (+),score=8.72 GHVQ01041070.1:232-588(+)
MVLAYLYVLVYIGHIHIPLGYVLRVLCVSIVTWLISTTRWWLVVVMNGHTRPGRLVYEHLHKEQTMKHNETVRTQQTLKPSNNKVKYVHCTYTRHGQCTYTGILYIQHTRHISENKRI